MSSALLAGGTLALDRSLSSEIVELGIFFSAGSEGAGGGSEYIFIATFTYSLLV